MSKVRLNLNRLSIPQKIAKAQQIITAMTGNPNFPTPTPPLVNVTNATNDLKTAHDAVQAITQAKKEKTSVQNQKEQVFDQVFTQLASYVESQAGNNEQMILSAGMDVRAPAAPSTEPPSQPQALAATAGDRDGEIDLAWEAVAGAKSYTIERSGDPVTSTSWQHGGVSTRSSYTANGLTSGTRYWFRVAAVNNNGQSGWSDPAMKIAP